MLSGAASSGGDRARVKVQHPDQVRILQLTDLHFFRKEGEVQDRLNRQTVSDMQRLVELAKPDVVMVTGDVWSENPGGKGDGWLRYAIARIEELGLPWAFTWGNHDQVSDLAAAHGALTDAPHSRYRGGASDGNYVIDLENSNGVRMWQCVCLNSHRDGLQAAQRQWFEEAAKADPDPVPRFAFFHIPLRQYQDAWTNGTGRGMKGEDVCLEKEDGTTLSVLKSLGVRACFCGHDHCNDYSGVVDGVELVYGRVSRPDAGGKDNFKNGGKLITLDCGKGRWQWESITTDGARWRPKPDERVEFPD